MMESVLALQWGRGSLAAACAAQEEMALKAYSLQWGRGSLAAACCDRSKSRARSHSFNGAAAH